MRKTKTALLSSMTGYGQARFRTPQLLFAAQARSVNHRFLDIKLRLPRAEWMALDHAIRKSVAEEFARGAIEILVTVEPLSAQGRASQALQAAAIEDLLQQIERWRKSRGARSPNGKNRPWFSDAVSLDTVLRLPGVFANPVNTELERFDENELLGKLIRPLFESLKKSRGAEGSSLRDHLLEMTRQLRARLENILALEAGEQARVREALNDRIQNALRLLGEAAAPAAASQDFSKRLAEEAAFWIDRRSFEEERVRFATHLDSFEGELNSSDGAPKGRKLEFLHQELHREVNTLANKAQNPKIAEHALMLKSTLENLKEQLANVE